MVFPTQRLNLDPFVVEDSPRLDSVFTTPEGNDEVVQRDDPPTREPIACV